MSELLSAQTREILDGLRDFLNAEVLARHRDAGALLSDPRQRYGPDGRHVAAVEEHRRAVRMASARAGYYTMCVPEELGGGGQGAVTSYAAWELINRLCGSGGWLGSEVVAHWATGPSVVFARAGQRLRDTFLGSLLSGEQTMCFAMSEPGAGSDVWQMSTRAVPEAGGWRLTGVKQWISNGPHADLAIVFAVTDPERVRARAGGISAFLVPTDAPGFQVDSVIGLYGQMGGEHAILSMNEVRVEDWQLFGEPGGGLSLGLDGIATGRLYNTAKGVGLARWALGLAVDFATERETFGTRLFDNQGISFPLADAATRIHAAHLMGLHAAELVDAGRPALTEVAMAKLFATEMATDVIDRAIQTLGGMGITTEVGLAKAWQSMRTVQIADGSSEILKRLISRRMANGEVSG
ncbi:acyl-CoA/acyl-ACP dehydrogenase [Micromonospora peucetia]|uniref:Acyl-CoA dehydrogenase n=1 Tax=Micromonospora peucetia TaxID=47871 RepID=A0A1C6W4M6_9ACTN|nr:acyl-CoA dehydrogenase family protein [Micromonospora peucetia]MCX4390080.1 acyl-CoA/acyl-ACP dehydrogenase [Micromonospora peucetia]WSA32610.1 acyl-CoA/acyl-ACP dehydrogenase [Micromonospora peucetia]SCL73477.1 acyl-CoA dehydrogenase [Micromonospora peucetia]